MFGWLEHRLVSWEPARRRRAAIEVLGWSVVLMIINVAVYLVGIIGDSELLLVTLILSWLALTVSAMDVVATTDVRQESP